MSVEEQLERSHELLNQANKLIETYAALCAKMEENAKLFEAIIEAKDAYISDLRAVLSRKLQSAAEGKGKP